MLLIDGFTPELGDTFDILNWTTLSGTFDDVLLPDLDPGLWWDTHNLYDTGPLGVTEAVPEPATWTLVGLGLAAGAAWRRRRGPSGDPGTR